MPLVAEANGVWDMASMEDGLARVAALPRDRDQLLPALQAMHDALHWLPREAISYVASHVRVPVSEVYATATAYSELRLEAPVPGQWHVCTGVACDLAGSGALLASTDNAAPIDCQFLCALAPVVVDEHEHLYGRVTADALRELTSRERAGS
jgi:NADH:ubiquinone oxidoreductase subunit E